MVCQHLTGYFLKKSWISVGHPARTYLKQLFAGACRLKSLPEAIDDWERERERERDKEREYGKTKQTVWHDDYEMV